MYTVARQNKENDTRQFLVSDKLLHHVRFGRVYMDNIT